MQRRLVAGRIATMAFAMASAEAFAAAKAGSRDRLVKAFSGEAFSGGGSGGNILLNARGKSRSFEVDGGAGASAGGAGAGALKVISSLK